MSEHGRAKLLLVDDLVDNLVALEALLRRDDVEILQARNGREALEVVLVNDVALAIVDVQMPEMDGFELAELMRGSERTRHIPIIFVTAGAREPHRIFQGYDAGAVDFMFKPVEAHVLRNKVNTFVELYQQRQRLSDQLARERAAQAERDRLLADLQETLRFNELFVAVLSHDLRNPVGAVRFSADALLKASEDPMVQRTAIRLKSVSERMGRMITELLDLARARLGGGIPVNARRMDLGALASRIAEELGLMHSDRRLEVVVAGDATGEWDEDRLAQVLSNLVANAIQHGLRHEPIEIRIDGRLSDTVRIAVTNGGSLPDEVVGRLFDPFRSGKTNGQEAQGLGLGLYIVQQIANAHGGAVEASSEKGRTTFVVTLARVAASASVRPQLKVVTG